MEEKSIIPKFFNVVDYCPMIKPYNAKFNPIDDTLKNLKNTTVFKCRNNLNG